MYTLETAIRRTKFKNLDIVQADLRKCRSTKNACRDYNDFTDELIQEVQ